ncbi:helix-turn-helix domain-containing protein [Cellulomonas sp.]|uniref:helix-turn-helix domain-containing protein n=1 Tax=Cellulomonas sp. TaxID=40001 RepID=UPI003BAAF63C
MLDDVLGLSAEESLAYRDLVAIASTSGEEMATRLSVSPADADRVLRALEVHGLVARSGNDSRRYVAEPPSIALGALLARRQDEVRLAELELGRLDEVYRNASEGRGPTDVIDVVRGADAVRQRFEQVQLGAREEVLAFVKPPVAVTSAQDNTAEDKAVARGVQYRIILERSMLDADRTTIQQATDAARAGERVRVADSVPLKLVVIDRRLAYLPLASDPGRAAAGALLVHESGLLDALVALFEAVWERATPLVSSPDQVPEGMAKDLDEVDAQVLSLLLAGLTDQAVASHLDLSLRTVQRRVRYLMDLAGVETRVQLGWQAARRWE